METQGYRQGYNIMKNNEIKIDGESYSVWEVAEDENTSPDVLSGRGAGSTKPMTRICDFPISKNKRCKHPVADGKPNCGRHRINLSAEQLGQNPTVYKKNGELHVWAGEPDDVYCLIHSDPAYQVLYQVAGETPPCCLEQTIRWRDEDGRLHRDNGPAMIWPDGAQYWYQHGKCHRDDGPAVIKPDGKYWYKHSKLHRDDGPARIWPDGRKHWYQHGRLHRDDGPAVIKADGTQGWYQHDKLHRDDGPAWIWPDGRQLWYQRNANGDQVCGFRELLDHLGTLTRNTVKVTTGTTNSFDMLTTPTPLQRQVFELLGAQVPHRLM